MVNKYDRYKNDRQNSLNKYDQKAKKRLALKPEKVDTSIFGKPLAVVMDMQKMTKPLLKTPEFIQDALQMILLRGCL